MTTPQSPDSSQSQLSLAEQFREAIAANSPSDEEVIGIIEFRCNREGYLSRVGGACIVHEEFSPLFRAWVAAMSKAFCSDSQELRSVDFEMRIDPADMDLSRFIKPDPKGAAK